jgi:ketosteroid isomerase-like protein
MTRILTLGLLLSALCLVTAGQDNDKSTSSDKSMILALESAWNQAELHHDANAVSAIIAENFISVDHHGTLLTRSKYLADVKDLSYKPEEISNSDTLVYLYGDTAIVTSAYRTRGTDSGKPFAHRGRFTDTWIKRDGKWQCIADHETLIN